MQRSPMPAYAQSMVPRQVMQESFRQSYKQMPDKENTYAQLQKRKVPVAAYASQPAFAKPEMRPSSSQPRPPSVQPVASPAIQSTQPPTRPSSASTDKRSYSSQKQPRASFKELKNSAFVQPTAGYSQPMGSYQHRYFSMKNEANTRGMVKSQSNQQLPAKPVDQQEYKKLHEKLQFLESKINRIRSNIETSNNQLQKQSERAKQKPLGLAAKFFQKREDNQETQQSQQSSYMEHPSETPKQKSINLDQFVTQVKQPSARGKAPINPVSTAITNLLTKVNRHQSLEINQSTQTKTQEKSYSSTKASSQENFLYYISSVVKAYFTESPSKADEVAREHLVQTIQGLEYARNLKLTSFEDKVVNLPRSHFAKTLVFDLDETLIHCNETVNIPGDVILPITFPTGDIIQASINIRPYAQQILQTLSRHFEIIVFTASHSCYANIVLDHLDPKKQWISHRLFREHCLQSEEGAYIKDLRVLGNRKLSNILLIDNASYSFGQQIENGVPIIAYYENKHDQELLYLQSYLMKFRNVNDVRELNSQLLRVNRYNSFQDPLSLLGNLFTDYMPKK